jgi:hypothetical protein
MGLSLSGFGKVFALLKAGLWSNHPEIQTPFEWGVLELGWIGFIGLLSH